MGGGRYLQCDEALVVPTYPKRVTGAGSRVLTVLTRAHSRSIEGQWLVLLRAVQ